MSVDSPSTWGLADAIEAGTAPEIDWIDVTCPRAELVLTVPRLPLACRVGDRVIRPSLSYAEQVRVCRVLGCVSPTYEWYLEIWHMAPVKLSPRPLVKTATDAAVMGTLDFLARENDAFEAQLAQHAQRLAQPGAFARGFCKLWIVHPKMADLGRHGACNVGFRYPNGTEIQAPGGRHNDTHLDYSQWAWDLPRREARDMKGRPVDLLERQCALMHGLATRLRAEYDSR